MRVLSCIVLATSLLSTVVGCRKAELPDFVTAKEKIVMETDENWSKGGVGLVLGPSDGNLFVVTKSSRNEMMWGYEEKSKNWIGRSSSTPEVVVFYDGKVWPPQSLPHGFDKSKSVVVSFEENNIRFYDYVHNQGGYYERHPPEERHDN
jgi:hypothetical protein